MWHDQLRASALTLMENTTGVVRDSRAPSTKQRLASTVTTREPLTGGCVVGRRAGTSIKFLDDIKTDRAAIAAATKVQYDDRELLQVIRFACYVLQSRELGLSISGSIARLF